MQTSSARPVVPPQSRPEDDGSVPSLDELVARCGGTDLMVFRQVEPGRFLQLGGVGRGAGWAGNIELVADVEPAVQHALAGDVVRWEHPDAAPVIGPYHARSAALVPVDHDVVVLVGNAGGRLSAADDVLRAAAADAVEHVGAVTPAKRLADELEVLAAVRSTMQCTPAALEDVLRHVTRSAAEALGCEIGIAWLPEHDRLVVVERGWSLGVSADDLRAALRALAADGQALPLCRQDSTSDPLPSPLGPANGVRSHFVLPLGAPADGLLVLLHTVVTPRGFTSLCQTVGERVAEAAGVVVHGAVLRSELERLVSAAEAAARRDPLTGLVNRLAWQEALDALQPRVAAGEPASIVVMDLNGLKKINDRFGHEAGDELLRHAATALRGAARGDDLVARLGGDEFAVLVPGACPDRAAQLIRRVREALAAAEPVHGVPLAAAVGAAGCPAVATLRDAFRAADAAMYADKARQAGGPA